MIACTAVQQRTCSCAGSTNSKFVCVAKIWAKQCISDLEVRAESIRFFIDPCQRPATSKLIMTRHGAIIA